MRELHITVKLPRVDETKISRAFIDYRLRNIKKSEEILLDEIHRQLWNRDMVVSRDLLESFEAVTLEETSDLSRVAVQSDDVAGFVAEYGAQPVGSGTGEGDDMTSEIFDWVKAKGISPEYGSQRDFAFAIARKIAETGQPLHGGLKRPLNAAQKIARRKIEKQWEEDLAQLLRDLEQR